ncbi:type II toxin-antitoxin system RelE/ParE family toxin [Bradyrhizobium jicamae]|uniref:type II toxin-antitoxin system RelE/ParE family toxin n=1 Tax=Bradyrhizobium jicamae TaxID=280332 RepID=UPI0024C0A4DF|nr:type II toxin-antitoxin system RelE/ParE family toxin [Bradyrhizobium jicamae]
MYGIYDFMSWSVENTDEFGVWWNELTDAQQEDVAAIVTLLEERGPKLPFPYSSGIANSRHDHMRELRVQSGGRPIRVFYAFDPRRTAILLIGGDKTGDDRFYEQMIPVADKLYDVYIEEIRKEGLIR